MGWRSSAFEQKARHQVVSASLLECGDYTCPPESIRKPSTLMPGVLTKVAIPGDHSVFSHLVAVFKTGRSWFTKWGFEPRPEGLPMRT